MTGRPELQRIGPYRLLKALGTGGMGTVYLAQQTEPIRRRVAVKLIRPRVAASEVSRRFEVERQALARMSHPNIAQAFEAGTTGDGQPYFVMEYVAGLPITDYCDRRRLPVRRRLELFIAICEGVQHAHQKGIIHRDRRALAVREQILEARLGSPGKEGLGQESRAEDRDSWGASPPRRACGTGSGRRR